MRCCGRGAVFLPLLQIPRYAVFAVYRNKPTVAGSHPINIVVLYNFYIAGALFIIAGSYPLDFVFFLYILPPAHFHNKTGL